MPKRKQQQEEPGEQQEPPAAVAKRRRSTRATPSTAAEKRAEPPAAAAKRLHDAGAAAAAAGQAASDEGDADGSSTSEGEAEEHSGHDNLSSDVLRDSKEGGKRWQGVYPEGRIFGAAAFRVRVRMPPEVGGGRGKMQELGTHASRQAAARVHDRALIAIMGRKVAAPTLNYPLAHYPEREERQRFGPELHAYLLRLSNGAGEEGSDGEQQEEKKKEPRPYRGATGEEAAQLRREALRKAGEVRRAKLRHGSAHAEALVAAHRAADPLWAPPRQACGVCPACRQPWRSDLGGCVRLAAMKAAGHQEQRLVRLLAANPGYVAALEAEKQRKEQEQEGRQRSPPRQQAPSLPPQQQRQQQQQQRARQRARAATAATPPPAADLEWLQQPARRSQATNQSLRKLQKDAMAPMRQQLAWDQSQFAAALEQEREQGPPRAAVGTATAGSRPKRRGGGGSSAGGAPASSVAAAAGQGQQAADMALVDPFSWLTTARAPRAAIQAQIDPADLLHLAALCQQGGMAAPLSVDQAEEVLEEEEGVQESLQRLLRRHQRLQRQGQQQHQEAGASDDASDGGELEVAVGEGEGPGPCLLCGSARHGRDMKRCPVMQMALAVPKPRKECPGCADREVPGCKLCLHRSSRVALAQPFVQRAPWVDQLAPATRQLMLAVQELASAAVADLDATAAAYRCTPKALLAVGLLAEEAARREVVARFGSEAATPAPAWG